MPIAMSECLLAPADADCDLREQAYARRELEWLLTSSDDTLAALRSGLEECLALLDSNGPASTLPFSSTRSESLKGVISRVGSRITRADLQVKMFGLPYTKGLQSYKLCLARPNDEGCLMLEQLTDVRNFVSASLDLLETPAGEPPLGATKDDKFVMERLCMLRSNVLAARAALKGTSPHRLFPYHTTDSTVFDPPLPATVSFDLYISDASLVAELRTLEPLLSPDESKSAFSLPSLDIASPFGFRERFAAAVGLRGDLSHDVHNVGEETNVVFSHKGVDVKVRERVRVDSQDPSLMAVWAKLGGLEHALGTAIKALRMVMVAAGEIQP